MTFNLGHVIGANGADGKGIVNIEKTGTSGLVDTYTITYTDGTTSTFEVTNGSSGTADIVTSWETTPSDEKVPSEKLTKNTLDNKVDKETGKGLFSGSYNDLTNKPTIPEGSSTATDIKMDGTQSAGSSTKYAKADHVHPVDTSRAASSHSHGKLQSDGSIGTSGNASKNVVTDSSGKIDFEDKPTIPVGEDTDSNILMDGTGDAGTSSKFARADHVHPVDTSRAASSHTHSAADVTDSNAHSNIGSSANDSQSTINTDIDTALSNKISKNNTTGLIKNNGDVETNLNTLINIITALDNAGLDLFEYTGSSIENLIVYLFDDKLKYNTYDDDVKYTRNGITYYELATMNDIPSLTNYIQKSQTSGLLKNDGTVDTTIKLTSSDIANNLTTTAAGKALDATQGKALADLIGAAISYINQ